LSLETQDQAQLQAQAERITSARERLADLQRELMQDLAEALRLAERSHKKKRGGWFSRNFGGAIDFVAKLVGRATEINKDLVVLQADLVVSVLQHGNDPQALGSSLTRDLLELNRSSETETATAGFLGGTARFAGDFLVFQAALVDALARGAVRGDAAARLVVSESSRLYGSFEHNILDNPDFWTVVERTAQAAAVAGAVSSGGALAPVALALIVAIEAENRYGYLDDVVGRRAAPWVQLGMQAGLVATSVGAGASNGLVATVQGATAVLQGVHSVHQGIETIRESRREAAELDANADVQETLNRMDQIRRLIDRLIETYGEQSEDQTTNRHLAAELAQAHAQSHAAVVHPA
jgi:hypothetical protein